MHYLDIERLVHEDGCDWGGVRTEGGEGGELGPAHQPHTPVLTAWRHERVETPLLTSVTLSHPSQ